MPESKNARERFNDFDKSVRIFEEWPEDSQHQHPLTPIEI
jgi:hypothetical protein